MSSSKISSFLCPCFLGIGMNISLPIKAVRSTLIRLFYISWSLAARKWRSNCKALSFLSTENGPKGNLLTQLCSICLATCAHQAVRFPELDHLMSGSHRVSEAWPASCYFRIPKEWPGLKLVLHYWESATWGFLLEKQSLYIAAHLTPFLPWGLEEIGNLVFALFLSLQQCFIHGYVAK